MVPLEEGEGASCRTRGNMHFQPGSWFLCCLQPSRSTLSTQPHPPLPVSDGEAVQLKKSVVLSEQQIAAFYLITDESLSGRCSHTCWPLMDSVS